MTVFDHVPSCFPALRRPCCSAAAQSDQCVSAERRRGETAHLSAINKRWRKGKQKKGGGCPLCTAAVKISMTPTPHPPPPAPDPSRWVCCHRSDLAGFKMAANQVTAARRRASDERASSPVHEAHPGLFCSHAVCRSQRAVESPCLLVQASSAEVGAFRFCPLNFT